MFFEDLWDFWEESTKGDSPSWLTKISKRNLIKGRSKKTALFDILSNRVVLFKIFAVYLSSARFPEWFPVVLSKIDTKLLQLEQSSQLS